LALLSGIIGIYSALRSHGLARDKFELERQQARNDHRASLIDDIEQVLNNVKEENGRLTHRIEELETTNRALILASDHQAACIEEQAGRIEELEAAYKIETEKNARLTKRVEELEAEQARLRHLKATVR
jgi:methyl-accepting chemotaxis protein